MQPPGMNRLATTTSEPAVGRFDEPVDASGVIGVVGRVNNDSTGAVLCSNPVITAACGPVDRFLTKTTSSDARCGYASTAGSVLSSSRS